MKQFRLFLVFAVLLTTAVFAQDVNKGLSGFWSFDDEANIGKDYSSFGNNGIDTNVTVVDGIVGKAIYFDGNSVFRVYNTVADNPELNFTAQGAISFWYKTTVAADNWMSVIRHEHHFTPLQMTQFDGGGKAWCVVFPDSVGSYKGTLFEWTDGFYNDDEWHHMVVTFKGKEVTNEDSVSVDVYWDGMHMTSGKFWGSGLQVNEEQNFPWSFGATEHPLSQTGEKWTGSLDQIRLYERYLTEDDVDVLFNEDTTPISVEELADVPTEFSLMQNYPNPFNPTTKIKFSIVEESNVSLAIYNVLGEKVQDLVAGEYAAGTYVVNFDAKDLASGIYYYTIKANDFTQTKKMVLAK